MQMGDHTESGDRELTEDQPLSHPQLNWKPVLRHERPLKPVKKSSILPTLRDAFKFVDLRKGKGIFLVTRVSEGWVIFEYARFLICKVDFDEIRIGGLPLGGNPFAPQTYIVNSKGHIARIKYTTNGYRLEKDTRPTEEPTTAWAVTALVPVPESNDGNLLAWLPRTTFQPTPDDLQSTQAWINQNIPGTKIKAGGSQHSWSQIANTNHIYILPDSMKLLRFIEEEADIYRKDLGNRRANLLRGGSGVTIREANRFLWERGKAFYALPGWDGQTLGGIFNTGTHGSCFTLGPIAEMIVSIDLVLADGTLNRIEPSDNNITDPESLSMERPDVKLVQDNDYFYSLLINMGTMGIVHSYVLEVTDAYFLKEVRTATKVAALREKLKGGKIYQFVGVKGKPADLAKTKPKISDGKDGGFAEHPFPAFHLDFFFNPHGDQIVVTSKHPVQTPDKLVFGFEPPGRDLIRTILMGARFHRNTLADWIEERFRPELVWIIDAISHAVPKSNPWLINRALKTLLQDVYIERSFNVFNFGEGQSEIPALSSTFFIPLENDQYLEALDIILAVAKQFAARGKYETAPIQMRFVRGTRCLIGCPKDFCAFECIFTASTKHAQEMIDAYDHALRQKFNGDVCLHWGQMMRDPDHDQIRSMYPRYNRWRAIRDELDPQGLFLNEWQMKILPLVSS